MAALRGRNWRSAEGRWGLPAQKGRVRGRRCPRKQAAEACDFANPGLGRCRSPTPGRTTRLPDLAAGCGAGGRPGPGSPGTSRLEVWRVSRGPIFSFGFSAKGWRIRMGTGLAAVWHRTGTFLKVMGQAVTVHRPGSLGHLFSAGLPASAVRTSIKHRQTQGTFPLSGLQRRD